MPSSACIKPDDDATSSVATDTRLMQQAQPKSAAQRADATTVRSQSWTIRWVGTLLSTSLRDGVPLEVVSKILGHSSVTTTSAVYGHLTSADARRALEAAGWFTGSEVSL